MRLWNDLGLTRKMAIFLVLMLLVIGALAGRFLLTVDALSKEAYNIKDQGAIGALMLAREIDHLNWIYALQKYVYDPQTTTLQIQVDPTRCGLGQWYYGAGRKAAVAKFPRLEAELIKMEAAHNALHASAVKIRQLKEAGDNEGALQAFNEVALPSVQGVQAVLKKVSSMTDQDQRVTLQTFARSVELAETLAIGFGALGALLALLMGVLIARTVTAPIAQIAKAAEAVASGDLDTVFALQRGDEIGSLAAAMRHITGVLQAVLNEFNALEDRIEAGELDAKADPKAYKGGFARLITDTNAVIDCFLHVLDHLPNPVLVMDKKLRVAYLNGIGRKVAGTDYKGKPDSQISKREDADTPADALKKAAETLRPASAETRAHPRGKDMDILYMNLPIVDGEGRLASVLQLVTDLTEVKRKERTIVAVADKAAAIADRVAAASEEISAQVEQVSQGAEQQRRRVESTATAMTEMNATVLEVAKSAGQAAEQSEATRNKAKDGADLVNKVVRSINMVNTVATTLQANMHELGGKAESIGGVMNVISDIADQTNLLALNAAIEAARAGDAGRGFAVVADEVRKLAEKTMTATQEVGANISAIQNSARTNIKEVGEAAKAITEATELANTSGRALTEIVDLASANSAVVASIATAAEEQSATSEEVSHAVEEINKIAGETANGMHQSSQALHELSRVAHELNTVMAELH